MVVGVVGRGNGLGELLGTVVLVEEVVGDFLEVGEMRVEEGGANGQEVGVARVVDFDRAPWVLTFAIGVSFPASICIRL